jgi:hypothetical protein
MPRDGASNDAAKPRLQACRVAEGAMSGSARAPWEAFSGSTVGRRFRGYANLPRPFRDRIVLRVCLRLARPRTPSGGKGRRMTRPKKAELSSLEEDETDPSPSRRRPGAPGAVTGDPPRWD